MVGVLDAELDTTSSDAEQVALLRTISNVYRDELGDHVQGDFVRYPAGSVHAPVALGDRGAAAGPSNPACVLYAIAREGVELVDGP